MKKLITAFALCLFSCTPTIPYTSEYLVGNLPKHWAVHESTVDKVVTVHNKYHYPTNILVHCQGTFFDGKSQHLFEDVPADGEDRAMITVRSSDAIVDVCEVVYNINARRAYIQ